MEKKRGGKGKGITFSAMNQVMRRGREISSRWWHRGVVQIRSNVLLSGSANQVFLFFFFFFFFWKAFYSI